MSVKGSCNCGGVKFEVDGSLSDVYLCHCSICRKSTGSSALAVAITSSDLFSWVEGAEQINTWLKPNHDWQTSFCTSCGSPLPGKNDQNAMYIPVSLLDSGAEQLQVRGHLFVDSMAAWDEIAGKGIQYKDGFKSPDG